MPARPPLLVTSALPYANGPLHLGHLAGAYLPADLYVRYQRLTGRDVVYVCGSDENGAAIYVRALQEGVEPQAIVDRYHAEIEAAFERLGISFDVYGRTTSETHHQTAAELFGSIARGGGFATRTTEQLFDPEAGLFLADRFVRGTCPVCGAPDAYGDQCETCGSALSPEELIDPRSTLSGAVPETRETTHWYLPLGEMQPDLQAYIDSREGWKPNVTGQVGSWFAAGLADRAMTRDIPWGVPVPESAGRAAGVDVDGKVLYVWFDAPIGYLSNTKEWAEAAGEPEAWRRYWQVGDGPEPELVHFIGKDNIVFHALVFPAILQAANAANPEHPAFVLPAEVPANEFLNLEGQKLSTSRGWAVWAGEALDAFPADALRYGLAKTLPETKDADFTWTEFAEAVGELADVFGNFANRALTFTQRFAEGRVPELAGASAADREALAALAPATDRAAAAYDRFRIREGVAEAMALARLGNKYFNDAEPWATRTADPQACANTIHVSLQLCASLSILLDPVVPHTAARLRAMLNLDGVRSSAAPAPADHARGAAPDGALGWADAARPLLDVGHALGEPAILVEKIDAAAVEAQRELLAERAAAAAALAAEDASEEAPEAPHAPLLDEIAFDDFARLDLRTGLVTEAEPHPKADRLMRLQIDLGAESRQVLSGIREWFAPDDVLGKRVVVVANLAPRTIRGLESQGMVLFAEDRDGALRLVESAGEPGSRVA